MYHYHYEFHSKAFFKFIFILDLLLYTVNVSTQYGVFYCKFLVFRQWQIPFHNYISSLNILNLECYSVLRTYSNLCFTMSYELNIHERQTPVQNNIILSHAYRNSGTCPHLNLLADIALCISLQLLYF